MSTASCVSFANRHGHLLHGVLHAPAPDIARGVCILMLSPGIKGRIGPHRLYLKLAERFVPMGFHLLRFDFHGLGDSEGELDEGILADVYNSIQGGRYVDDTIDAMDWLHARHGIGRFVGSGLCGGSITALLAAVKDTRIDALLGIGLPVVLDGGEENWGRFLTTHQARQARGEFFHRLLRPWTWLKFLSGRSNYRVIWRVIGEAFGFGKSRQNETDRTGDRVPIDDTNPLFAPAFIGMLRSQRPVLLVYSGADRLQDQFQEKFETRCREQIASVRKGYRIHTIANANHIMSDPAWVQELNDVAAAWLDEVQPAVVAAT